MSFTSFGYIMQTNTHLRFVGTRTSEHDDSISTITAGVNQRVPYARLLFLQMKGRFPHPYWIRLKHVYVELRRP